MVRTESLSKTFPDPKRGDVRAVIDASFEAKPGHIVGLLGKNGAGKSTLLRMLSTVLTPTGGRALVNDFDVVTHPTEVRRSIGFMSTSTALYGRMNPRETLMYFGELYGLRGSELKARVEDLIDRLEIGSYAEGLCDKLSTGQKQRVNIARTLLHDPQVLFFDEPTSGLDIVMSQDVMRFVEDERDRGKTIIYCTHIMSEVERLADYIVCIHEGTLMGQGTTKDLMAATGENSLEKAFLKTIGYQQKEVSA